MRKLRKKEKMLLMFPDGRQSISGWVTLLKVLYTISFTLAIISVIVMIVVLILAPILWLMLVIATLGLLLLAEKNGHFSTAPFAAAMLPVTIILVAITLGLYLLRFVVEWLVILKQTIVLHKDKEANKDRLAIARAVRLNKLVSLGVFAVIVALFIAGAAIMSNSGADAQKIMAIVGGVVAVAVFILGKVLSSKIYKKVQPSIDAVTKKPVQLNATTGEAASPWDK